MLNLLIVELFELGLGLWDCCGLFFEIDFVGFDLFRASGHCFLVLSVIVCLMILLFRFVGGWLLFTGLIVVCGR